jgi:hypothetical protein
MASDLQEPPELIPEFIAKWEQGYRVVAGVKPRSQHTTAMFYIRRFFYATIGRISDTRLIPNFTGFGLYDRSVVEIIRQMDDPYPYFRGMIADIGFEHAEIPFVQPGRRRGLSKNNFYTLYDMAILGITSHSKLPIRLATMAGFGLSAHQPGGGHRLSGLQAVSLGPVFGRHRPGSDRLLFLCFGTAFLHRRPRRVHCRHPHAGDETALGGGEGAHQLPAGR